MHVRLSIFLSPGRHCRELYCKLLQVVKNHTTAAIKAPMIHSVVEILKKGRFGLKFGVQKMYIFIREPWYRALTTIRCF